MRAHACAGVNLMQTLRRRRLITPREDLMGTNLFSGPIVGGINGTRARCSRSLRASILFYVMFSMLQVRVI